MHKCPMARLLNVRLMGVELWEAFLQNPYDVLAQT